MPANGKDVESDKPLSIVIVGASGDLARKKIIPALFALYCQNSLPPDFRVFGFSRTELSDEAFREKIQEHLSCRYAPGASCGDKMETFLPRCHYVAGHYDSADSFLDLFQVMKRLEGGRPANRLYYLAIPPTVFLDVAHSIGNAGLVSCGARGPWSRVVIEKPFGRDRASSDVMAKDLGDVFSEGQIYRIDHYLGKELLQNLMVLRFANTIFEPLWNAQHIESVQICWKEDIGTSGRGGYFDHFGIVRDVMQNHLLQILSLVAMEPPASFKPQPVRDEKVRLLRAIPPLTLDDLVVGQYTGTTRDGRRIPGYVEEPGVPPQSLTPTFGAAVLHVNNDRWRDVPFIIKAGKGLDTRVNEIRIRFRKKAVNLFADVLPELPNNLLVIRVQPAEAIYFRIVSKIPGLELALDQTDLDLQYASTFRQNIPDAYECLLLDALQGDKSLFIRSDELAASWDIFTPVLHELEQKGVRPEPYEFGSLGPAAADRLAARYKAVWT